MEGQLLETQEITCFPLLLFCLLRRTLIRKATFTLKNAGDVNRQLSKHPRNKTNSKDSEMNYVEIDVKGDDERKVG